MSTTVTAPGRTSTPDGTGPRRAYRSRRPWPMMVAAALLAWSTVATPPVGAADGDTGFSDVAGGGAHSAAIAALAGMGVFADTECGKGLFCPEEPVERWVMAVWLLRVLGGEVPTTDSSRFADVDSSRWWSRYTEAFASRGITTGCATGPLRYCPDRSVTRAQMATFLVRAFRLPNAPAAGFADTGGNTHRAGIDALAGAGITTGCATGPLRYCPDRSVTRAQMATFLHRALMRQREQQPETVVRISDDVPDADLTDVTTGTTVNFRSVFGGDKAVMLWFWAPW